MTPQEKELALLETILLSIPDIGRDYENFKDGAVIYVEEIYKRALDISQEDIEKILWKWDQKGVIERGQSTPDPIIFFTAKLKDYKQSFDQQYLGKVNLVLHKDNYLCIKGFSKTGNCYIFRNRKGKNKRIKILRVLIGNDFRKFTAQQIAGFTNHKSAKTVNTEFKRLFKQIAKTFNFTTDQLYTSDNNGYQLNCSIEIVEETHDSLTTP